MQVGDLVRQRFNPQGAWLVTKIVDTGWFLANGHGNGWLRMSEYEVISERQER